MQINFFVTFYNFMQKLFVGDFNDASDGICDDETSEGFEKIYLHKNFVNMIDHHKFYEYGVIPARILIEIELKLNPFIKQS